MKDAHAETFDALVLPGGLMSQVRLRLMPAAADFIEAFDNAGKPIVAINHGTALIRCGQLCGAGGNRMDCPCLVAGNVITGGWSPNLPALEEALAHQLIDAHAPPTTTGLDWIRNAGRRLFGIELGPAVRSRV